jgi:hypothetical protein
LIRLIAEAITLEFPGTKLPWSSGYHARPLDLYSEEAPRFDDDDDDEITRK